MGSNNTKISQIITFGRRLEKVTMSKEKYRWLFENMNKGVAVYEIIYDIRAQFMLCDFESINQQRRGLPVLSRFVARPKEVHPIHAFLDSFLSRRGVDTHTTIIL